MPEARRVCKAKRAHLVPAAVRTLRFAHPTRRRIGTGMTDLL